MAVRATAILHGRPIPQVARRSRSRPVSRCGRRVPPDVRASVDATSKVGARTGGDARRVPVLIVPGFLSSASEYEGMADALRRFDASVDVFVVPLKTKDWYPTLVGGNFRAILDAVDRAATEALRASGSPPEETRLRVVGHSAGGWLARTWLGSSPYLGRTYGGARKTRVLLTLGTPHYSLERYPFGRAPEKLFVDAEAEASFARENKRRSADASATRGAESPWTASRAAESTLALTNFRYPGAFEAGVRYVSVCGCGVVGATPRRWVADALGLEREAERATLASVGAGVSYAASCGACDGVDGDGVTPLRSAMLIGAKELVLTGVTHKPKPGETDDAWYGAPRVVRRWAPELLDDE